MNKRNKHRVERALFTTMFLVVIVAIVAVVFFTVSFIDKKKKEKAEAEAKIVYMECAGPQLASAFSILSNHLVFDMPEMNYDELVLISKKMKPDDPYQNKIDEALSAMSLEEKLYQLFIVKPEDLVDVDVVTAAGDSSKEQLGKKPVGGIIYFGRNLDNPDQTKAMLKNMQNYSYEIEGLPLFLCVDEEGGSVARIANNASFSVTQVGDMADIKSEGDAKKAGQTVGKYLQDLGFNFDFAPDADVLTNAESVIGKRSFGDNPTNVAKYAGAFSDGLHEYGIMSTFKHFPGHGAVSEDTHDVYASSEKTYDEIKKEELIPFMKAGEYGVDAIMVGHISFPEIIGDRTPASFSKKMITEILREKIGYEGLVVTDALNMGAITQNYSSTEVSVKAIEAGADIILMPGDFAAAYKSLKLAVEDGDISEKRIDESVSRILRAKFQLKQYYEENNIAFSEGENEEENVDESDDADDSETEQNLSNLEEVKSRKSVIDVSTYQGGIDWNKVKEDGVYGAIIRLGYRGYGAEGTMNPDDRFAQNLTGATNAGLKVGVYFHSEAKNTEEAEEEARYVLQQLKNAKLTLPIGYDLEYSKTTEKRSNDLSTEQRTANALAFCKVIESAGYKAMVYYDVTAKSDKTIDTTKLSSYRIWVADYNSKDKPKIEGSYYMWQHSEQGRIEGISGMVDLDYIDP